MPIGGDGVYYFSTYLLGKQGVYGRFDIYLNDGSGSSDWAPGSCSAVVSAVAGK